MDKRPKDMTPDEIAALPVRPIVTYREEKHPELNGVTVLYPVAAPMTLTFHHKDDIMFWMDAEGQAYTFGQDDNGSWHKRPFYL